MPIVEGLEQGTADWLAMRVGIVTGSRMEDVMNKPVRKQGELAARRDYRAELVCEQLTNLSAEHYITPAMRWGLENEVFARAAYELLVDDVAQAGHYEVADSGIVQRVGFSLHPTIKLFGASPDALVGKDGLAEFKCPTTATHLSYIRAGVVPPEYHWQMLSEIVCAEREWCDFVSYDPRLPKKYQRFVRRLQRDDQRIKQMEAEVVQFLAEVEEEKASLAKCTMVDLDGTLVSKLKESLGDA